ncbi:DNA-binding protein inhibitor ID-3-like [Arapaima gigas]
MSTYLKSYKNTQKLSGYRYDQQSVAISRGKGVGDEPGGALCDMNVCYSRLKELVPSIPQNRTVSQTWCFPSRQRTRRASFPKKMRVCATSSGVASARTVRGHMAPLHRDGHPESQSGSARILAWGGVSGLCGVKLHVED